MQVLGADQMRKFAAQVRTAAVRTGRVTVYYDGQRFDFRSAGREIAEDEMLIVGVYSPTCTQSDIREDMAFVAKNRRASPNRQVRK